MRGDSRMDIAGETVVKVDSVYESSDDNRRRLDGSSDIVKGRRQGTSVCGTSRFECVEARNGCGAII